MKNCKKTKRMQRIRKGMEKYLSGRKKSLERFVDVHYKTLYKYALSLITTVYAAVGNKLYAYLPLDKADGIMALLLGMSTAMAILALSAEEGKKGEKHDLRVEALLKSVVTALVIYVTGFVGHIFNWGIVTTALSALGFKSLFTDLLFESIYSKKSVKKQVVNK